MEQHENLTEGQTRGFGPAEKKPYGTPRLEVFGDLRRLTRAAKGGINGDGLDGDPTAMTMA